MFDSDLNIFYSGGSGGFYLLHCLLLKKQHFCWFPYHCEHGHHAQLRLAQTDYNNIKGPSWPTYKNYVLQGCQSNAELKAAEIQWAHNAEVIPNWADQQFELVHKHQWNINTAQWKSSEVWPVNANTLTSASVDRPYRIFFVCNDTAQWLTLPGKKIVLYTDVKTQIRLSMYKKAWRFANAENTVSTAKTIIRCAKDYKGCLVSENTFRALEQADHAILLQDFVGDMLSKSSSSRQHQFTQQWLDSHPIGLLRKCRLR